MPEILTTHVGSLPRGTELVPLLLARDHGEPYDAAALERLVQTAVEDAVARQEAAGVSIVSDGELGKVGYSTYVKERLSGFGGNVELSGGHGIPPGSLEQGRPRIGLGRRRHRRSKRGHEGQENGRELHRTILTGTGRMPSLHPTGPEGLLASLCQHAHRGRASCRWCL